MPRKRKRIGGLIAKTIDLTQLEALATIQCTIDEAAAVFGLSKRHFIRRMKEPALADAWEQGLLKGKMSVRRQMFRHMRMANSAGVQACIHLAKHHLGQTERAALELSGRIDSHVEVTSARDRIAAKLARLGERISGRVAQLAADAGATPNPLGVQ